MDPLIGQYIDERYRLTRLLGQGGMSRVYEATDIRLFDKRCAVKILASTQVEAEELARRFDEEIQISVLLGEHPRIIQVRDFGIHGQRPYLVMEYLGDNGHNLADLLAKEAPLKPQRVVNLAYQICQGLHHAHTINAKIRNRDFKCVLHRDLKPSNIFVLSEGNEETIKILDFGLAKAISNINRGLTRPGCFLGTPSYAAPEQHRLERLGVGCDIYALGIILYEMLTKTLPFWAKVDEVKEWREVHIGSTPTPMTRYVNLPPALVAVVMACLAKDPRNRPASMEILGKQLKNALS